MGIRDYSNVSDKHVPLWVRQSRQRARDIEARCQEFLKEWEKEKPKWTAKAQERKREEDILWGRKTEAEGKD